MPATKMCAPSSTPVQLMSKKNQILNGLTARLSVWHVEYNKAHAAKDEDRLAFVDKQIKAIMAEMDRIESEK
jgi:hypothetical protein